MQRFGWVALLLCGVAGFAIGFAVARSDRFAAPWAAEPGQRVSQILAGNDPLKRAEEIAALLPQLDPSDVPAVLAAYDKAALDGGDVELALFAFWWGRFDPDAAYAWTKKDWRASRANVLAALVRGWARKDPEKAYAGAQGFRSDGERELATDAAIAGWDESGKPGLIEFIATIPDIIPRQKAAEVLARRRVVSLGADGAIEWVQSLPPGEFREMMLVRVASWVTMREPQTAARWAEPQIAAAARPTGLPRRIATRWVLWDPLPAMEWLESLPAGPDRDDGVLESFRDWLRNDYAAAVAWIEAATLEPWNEPAFGLYARAVVARTDPRKALELSSRITSEDTRNYNLTVIARGWLERDRPAADAWIQAADLPEDVRERAYMVRTKKPGRFPGKAGFPGAAKEDATPPPELTQIAPN